MQKNNIYHYEYKNAEYKKLNTRNTSYTFGFSVY